MAFETTIPSTGKRLTVVLVRIGAGGAVHYSWRDESDGSVWRPPCGSNEAWRTRQHHVVGDLESAGQLTCKKCLRRWPELAKHHGWEAD